jgi:hypothetical protein
VSFEATALVIQGTIDGETLWQSDLAMMDDVASRSTQESGSILIRPGSGLAARL